MSNKLFEQFSGHSKEEWIEQVIKERKGQAFEELRHSWASGIDLEPFYHPDDDLTPLKPVGRTGNNADWNIGTWICSMPESSAEELIHPAIESDIDALFFQIEGSEWKDFFPALKSTHSPSLDLHILLSGKDAGDQLMNKFQGNDAWSSSSLQLIIRDDLSAGLKLWMEQPNGSVFPCFQPFEEDPLEALTGLLNRWNKAFEQCPEELRNRLAQNTHFFLPSGELYFVEIAKIRALKITWLNLMKKFDLPLSYPEITSYIPRDIYGEDPQINHIKATVSAMASVLGGADTLIVRSIHGTKEQASPFSQRMARNILHILKLESYFDEVTDPVAGSFYLDTLTTKLAERTWEECILS